MRVSADAEAMSGCLECCWRDDAPFVSVSELDEGGGSQMTLRTELL